jgi:hypothetical protein
MMLVLAALVLLGGSLPAFAASETPERPSGEGASKGLTVEELKQGLKSAADNVEKEIPKIGSAIGNLFKKATERTPEKSAPQEPVKK